MKKTKIITLITIISSIILFASCASLKLNGSYPSTQHFTETSLSQDEVWSNIIDYFATNGIPITVIDKSSGLIVSNKVSFINAYTREEKGVPINPNAYVVIPTMRGGFGNILEPSAMITGEWVMLGDWNVRIKSINNKTQIYINLINLDCYYSTSGLYGSKSTSKIPIASTGVFEKQLLDLFK